MPKSNSKAKSPGGTGGFIRCFPCSDAVRTRFSQTDPLYVDDVDHFRRVLEYSVCNCGRLRWMGGLLYGGFRISPFLRGTVLRSALRLAPVVQTVAAKYRGARLLMMPPIKQMKLASGLSGFGLHRIVCSMRRVHLPNSFRCSAKTNVRVRRHAGRHAQPTL